MSLICTVEGRLARLFNFVDVRAAKKETLILLSRMLQPENSELTVLKSLL